ncbi:MAG: D-glycero-beta-D-manno-heptose 1,7-bisphosphate 7-phosphatase [Candidatus Thiodiazotropha taylori]|nr:D-glycero-beta-D-manno-heptose 1,7-bisphosphate 7-phosphatase [Candidatus Thiodiazotropha taylori]MCG8070405.1 D-glycero-beta-D-manno-heptose 1,7-bisphosphate 7-phosphatase [Candidatus Thiodiazotropha taylori]MCW4246269.1 D-glycero-beta-D-manno-heptose 1,7-bisphosphate 7-phosphatase [Candidatus Thiodiazotropha taylori]MCW4324415.1 D-glycero-beta-D-manno-heptose 1,7-bisphosphate 7-phosphatase [Candidatus Thiodiazotropha taylori]
MKLIILDRDGVINHDSEAYIKHPDEWQPIDGSLEAIARLSRAGYRVFVATNQSGLARGLFDIETLNRIHQKMVDSVQQVGGHIEGIVFCPHGPDEGCDCRKPDTGLYETIAQRSQTALKDVPIVGDSLRDLQAADKVGAQPILVRSGNGEKTAEQLSGKLAETPVYENLNSFALQLINEMDTQ